jgi:hypothetical protein
VRDEQIPPTKIVNISETSETSETSENTEKSESSGTFSVGGVEVVDDLDTPVNIPVDIPTLPILPVIRSTDHADIQSTGTVRFDVRPTKQQIENIKQNNPYQSAYKWAGKKSNNSDPTAIDFLEQVEAH